MTRRRSFDATDSNAGSGGSRRSRAAIFVLHHYVGLTLPEVAEELGVPLGTVKSRMHYARKTLRAALDADSRTPTVTERLA